MAVKPGAGTRTASRKARGARAAAPRRAPREPPIGIVHLAAECWPFARTGGLGEAVRGLAAVQAARGDPTTIVMPLYQRVRVTTPAIERTAVSLAIPLGSHTEHAWLYRLPQAAGTPDVFFIEHPDFFDRPGIYGDNSGDYADNARRFAFFCRAALAALPEIAPGARILHAHDWHTALAPVYLRTVLEGNPFYDRLAAIVSVHNAAFQGHFPPETVADVGLPSDLYRPGVLEWYGRMNFLQGGLAFADLAVTVSPTHAIELRTPEGGFGLQEVFTGLGDRLVGILNGIDPLLWDPATDPEIPARYSLEEPAGKRDCKAALQQAYGLASDPQAPLFAMSARMVSQKGLDLILGADLLGNTAGQFIFLGAGEHRYHEALTALATRAPERVAVEFMFTDRVEHRLLAGADALLMPSLYEPCGLTQMRAQHYGAIPVVRRVGGLSDSVEDGVTGFLFDAYEPAALATAIRRASDAYDDRPLWKRMVRAAMTRQFGWDRSAERYRAVYARALAGAE